MKNIDKRHRFSASIIQHAGFGDTYFLDEVFVKIGGQQYYLWRAVDQDGECFNDCMVNQVEAYLGISMPEALMDGNSRSPSGH